MVQLALQQQQVPPPAEADASEIQEAAVQAAEPEQPAEMLEQERPRLTSTRYMDRYLKHKVP